MKTNHPKLLPLAFSVFITLMAASANAFYNPTTGRWLSRDPIEEGGGGNIYNFVSSDSVNSYDLLGELRIAFLSYTKLECGGMSVVWALVLDNPARCEGYFIQEVKVYEDIRRCSEPLPTATPAKPKMHFWEAFGPTLVGELGRDSEDTFYDAPFPNRKGTRTNLGTVKFFCKSVTGNLGAKNQPPPTPIGGWGIPRRSPAGGLPMTQTKPSWWDNTPEEGPAYHRTWASWDCCCDPPVNEQTYEPQN